MSMCPAPQKQLGGASQPQRRSGPELWISSARRRRVRAARGRAARPRGLTWVRPHLPGPRGVSGACVGRGYAGQEETGAGGLRLIPGIPRAPERARVLENPKERSAFPSSRAPERARLRPLRPRQGPASLRRASGECRVPWPGSGDLRRPGPAADRERLLVLAGRSSSG